MQARIEQSLADRPSRWFRPASAQIDLWYLGWGRRYFGLLGRRPIRRGRWSYFVVRAGTPTLLSADHRLKLSANSLVIAHPDFPLGWADETRARADLFLWAWDSPPRRPECRPSPGGFLHHQLRPEDVARLQNIHAACRDEVAALDECSPLAVEHLRLWLDVTLARCLAMPPAANLFEHAIQWMQQNLALTHCTSLLADYLQVTPARLEKLFRKQLGRTPLRHFQELKMNAAREMLQQGKSVKEIAYTLGYQHPNDFSRAFQSIRGKPPTAFQLRRCDPRPSRRRQTPNPG